MPVNPNNIESQNGWYQVGVIANSYGGNPGHANAKLAWIKGDFCKVVDVDMNAKSSQIAFPRNFSYDDEREEEVKGPLVTIREGLRRKSGLYTNLTFFVTASPDGNSILVTAPILSSHFVFIARTSIDVQYDSEQKSAVVLHEVEEENEIGDVDTFLRLTTNTEAQKSKLRSTIFLQLLIRCLVNWLSSYSLRIKSLLMRSISWIRKVNAKVSAMILLSLLFFRLRVLLCLYKSSA